MANKTENVQLSKNELEEQMIESTRRRLDDYAKILRANGWKVIPPPR
jgi:nitrogen fixation protein